MKIYFEKAMFFETNKKTLADLMRAKAPRVSGFGDLQFVEVRRWNKRLSDFNKYVWVFHNGENVTPLIGLYLMNEVSKSKAFCGALKNHGHGFWYADYLMNRLQRRGYRNFEDVLLRLVSMELVKIVDDEQWGLNFAPVR